MNDLPKRPSYNVGGLGFKVISEPWDSEKRSIFDIVFFNIYESPKSDIFRGFEAGPEEPSGLKLQLPLLFPDARVLLVSRRYMTESWLETCEVRYSISVPPAYISLENSCLSCNFRRHCNFCCKFLMNIFNNEFRNDLTISYIVLEGPF
jgi:hypothetical protein